MEKNKIHITELGNNESNCLIYFIFLLMEKDQKYNDILYDFLNKIIDFIYKSCSYNLSHKGKKINIFILYILSKIMEFFAENENHMIINNFKKRSLLEIQVKHSS